MQIKKTCFGGNFILTRNYTTLCAQFYADLKQNT